MFIGARQDGKTAYERLKDKALANDLCESGEKVLYMPLKVSGGLASADARYKPGIWLGIDERSSEVIIGTQDGEVVGARFVNRLLAEDKWCREMVELLKGTSWNKTGGHRRGRRHLSRT